MAKISLLPALNNPDGTELVPVVKNGQTMRASVAGLVAGAVAGSVDNLKVDATAYIGRPGDAALVDGTPTGIGAIYWHDTVDDTGSVIAVDVFDRAAGTINLASYRGPLGALARVALTSFKTTGTRTSRRIMLAEPIPVRAGDILAVQPTAGALVVAEVQSGDVGYTYSAPYLPETIALDAPTTNGQVQVRFVIAYRKQVVTADTFLGSTAAKIIAPRAVALSSDVNPRGYVEWTTTGQPTKHLVKWGNYTASLDGKAQRMEFPNYSLAQPYAFIGNSLTDSTDVTNRWSQLLAADYGQPFISVARYSSDGRMVYRTGAKPIELTLAGALPANGPVAVSRINGAPIDGNNPAAFLTTGDPGVLSGMSMSGYLKRNGITRRATVSAPNGASFAYVVTQAPGQTAITFDGPVTFVPDFALSVRGRICVIWIGNNFFYSGVANAYGDYTNPQMWVDLKLIVAFLQSQGCRVLLIPIIPSANTAEGDNWLARGPGTPYTAMESANARTEAEFPGLVARHADGRRFLKFLQDRNDGSPEALDDVAKGFTPRNLRRISDGVYDLLHMYGDGAGDRAVKEFVVSALQAQVLPDAVTQTTDFVITAIGAEGQLPDTALVRVSRDPMGSLVENGLAATQTAIASLSNTVISNDRYYYDGKQVALGAVDAAFVPDTLTFVDGSGMTFQPAPAVAYAASAGSAVTARTADSATTAGSAGQINFPGGSVSGSDRYYFDGKQVAEATVDDSLSVLSALMFDGSSTATLPSVGGGSADVTGGLLSASDRYYYDGKQVVEATVGTALEVIDALTLDGNRASGGGTSAPVIAPSLPAIVCVGDSLTAADYPERLALLTGRTVAKLAIGGQTSRHSVGRMSAVSYRLTLTDNQIVAGNNVVTAFNGSPVVGMYQINVDNVQFLSTASDLATRTATGWLGSVHGVLTRMAASATSETYWFTPDEGSILPAVLPAGTPFIVDYDMDERTHVLWLGRNNAYRPAQVLADVAAAVRRIGHNRIVIMPAVNGNYPNERSSSADRSNYDATRTIENGLAETFPRLFLNIRRLLISKAPAALGLTLTDQDKIDIADDTVPAQLRTDNVHHQAITRQFIAAEVAASLLRRGI